MGEQGVATIRGDAARRAGGITTVVFDVDGVLTDGGIYIDAAGGEMKRFDVQDGTGIKYLARAGLRVALISGRDSKATAARARELEIADVYQGFKRKMDAWEDLKRAHGLEDIEIACVGDDMPDIPLMRQAGLAVAVANARPEVRAAAQYVTGARGGRGAAREFCEWLLRETGRWEEIMERYGPLSGETNA